MLRARTALSLCLVCYPQYHLATCLRQQNDFARLASPSWDCFGLCFCRDNEEAPEGWHRSCHTLFSQDRLSSGLPGGAWGNHSIPAEDLGEQWPGLRFVCPLPAGLEMLETME